MGTPKSDGAMNGFGLGGDQYLGSKCAGPQQAPVASCPTPVVSNGNPM